ncbi:chorismate mutase [Roseinatronobacter monicus]|uniref:chorismate mutase n=1 Tax=Roseinatronobacter monicus TaxID=393481 RepID=A0A543KFD5_9RHOB|nr:chorismate mutase [Roseinatronobacter monicus]TQM93737.1 chorismate mutase [Roseinatronobacter monicus]
MRPPSECRNMAELRDQIDRLDRKLVGLFSERAAYIDRAAELKPAEGLPARINARVTEVRNNVRAEALAQGWDPELADSLWSQLIDWSIAREEKILGQDEQE